MRTRIRSCSIVAFACLTSAYSALAESQSANLNALLHGSYRFTTTITCADSAGGFDSELPELPALDFGTSPIITHSIGTITYDGAGNATHRSRDITVFPGVFPGQSPIGTGDVTCSFTYTVKPDLTFTQGGLCHITALRGGAVGQTIEIAVSGVVGQMTRSGDVLILSEFEPNQRLVQLSGGFSVYQICGSATTAVRIGRPRHE